MYFSWTVEEGEVKKENKRIDDNGMKFILEKEQNSHHVKRNDQNNKEKDTSLNNSSDNECASPPIFR